MSEKQISLTKTQIFIILGAIWLASNLCDRLWLGSDRSVPAWDQSNHLVSSLKYLHALPTPHLWDGEWWRSFWRISTKYPPLTYILTALVQAIAGTGSDRALFVNFFYSALLLLSVYGMGKTLFSPRVGLWAAGLAMLFPRLYQERLSYLIDTPLMALTAACFCCLTIWRSQKTRRGQWLWALGFGISWGCALLTKQSVMFFLLVPLLWLSITYLWQRQWQRIAQLIGSFFLSACLWFPWYRTNWIFLFSTYQTSNTIPASSEGDPSLNTLAAWTYYWNDLPRAVSWVLLLIPLVGLLLHLLGRFPKSQEPADSQRAKHGVAWLALYFISSYLICSALYNKDPRFVMPYLPVVAVFLAYCLLLWRRRLSFVRWLAVGLALLVMGSKLLPIPGLEGIAAGLSPGESRKPYLGQTFPHTQVIAEVMQAAPYLRSTLGVIPSTAQLNHNTFNYFGALANFQVYGRELGSSEEKVAQDGRSLQWFITKTGDNGWAREAQIDFAKNLEQNRDFRLLKSWSLPDDSRLKLYQRQTPTVTVEPISQTADKVQLTRVIVPARVPPDAPIPVTYEWTGPWEQLESGLVLLTWKANNSADSTAMWLHDHGIGMGMLDGDNLTAEQRQGSYRAIEQTAMLPKGTLVPGDYTLSATYLNRKTGETYPLAVPAVIPSLQISTTDKGIDHSPSLPVSTSPLQSSVAILKRIGITLSLDAQATPAPAPVLDFVTQLRTLALELPKGRKGLDPIFKQVARLNQYDPTQDYLQQADRALDYRLTHHLDRPTAQQQLEWNYGLVLARVLQEDTAGAIAALQDLVQRDANNPYAHAYLAFVYLYDWQPQAAQKALQPALKLQPNLLEIQTLNGLAAFMQGHFLDAWHSLSPLLGGSRK